MDGALGNEAQGQQIILDPRQLRQMEQQEIQKQLASVPSSVHHSHPTIPKLTTVGMPSVAVEIPQASLPSLLNLKIAPPIEMQLSGTPEEHGNKAEEERDGDNEDLCKEGRNGVSDIVSTTKLPVALEQALALKTERVKELGGDLNDDHDNSAHGHAMFQTSHPSNPASDLRDNLLPDSILLEDLLPEPDAPRVRQDVRGTKNRKKKKKRKKKSSDEKNEDVNETRTPDVKVRNIDDPQIEYIQEIPSINDLEPMYRQFARVFDAFKLTEPDVRGGTGIGQNATSDKIEPIGQYPPLTNTLAAGPLSKIPPIDDFDDDPSQQNQHNQQGGGQGIGEGGTPRLSKRKLKRLTRLSVAELKQLVGRPDVVEMHDVTARDPKLLVQLKAHRNTVPVPRHWCFKRKYLQGKRGIEKPPFDLPDFIKRTGITEMRASLQERDDTRTLKAKMRERARPKLGKIDIDYQKLHDAFFKWQTKPRMTIHGDLYYEGKEFETRLKEKKPGELSDELRTALGMPVGPNCHKVPPPWLIAMQRYGPPPSYPNLKIPGLNAPIPEGCAFGYHAGGWGKPPVDETGRPLYGDVFGVARAPGVDAMDEEVDRGMWGEPESESSGEDEDEDDAEDGNEGDGIEGKEGDAGDASGLVTPGAEGLVTPSGIASIPAGLETPETIELRKKKIESEMEGGDTPALYQVLQERRAEGLGASMMGSTHVYDMTGAVGGQAPPSVIAAARRSGAVGTSASGAGGGGLGTAGVGGSTSAEGKGDRDAAVELALDPSELDLDSEAMASRYEETMRSRQAHLRREDLSDMLQDHVQRQKSKRKRQQNQETKASKKYKEFKF
ncbi:splicing factor 3B subunit 2 [Neodiprion virginianus]|uniref:splicing factor 3B subunit 2 n=1 Tax=Neodiprion virginianus TaxID=2961670 RepID=UPI001EE69F1B|nr:splicing factor 3B subunit 2 [Neodiprion virginianus]XP_046628515.1 splicing factor 3B subunit 2 [Neodiprion virginianus]